MDDPLLVRRLEALARSAGREGAPRDGNRAARDARGEVLALDQLHDQEAAVASASKPWRVATLGWLSAASERASRSKRASALAVAGELLGQHLDRHLAPEPRVARAIDLTHPSRAEERQDLVGPEGRALIEPHLAGCSARL